MDLSTGNVEQLVDEIKILKENKEFEKAESLIVEALEESHRPPALYFHLAQIYDATGRSDDAVKLLQDGIELWPEVKFLRNQAAVLFNKKEAYSDAVAVLSPVSDFDLIPSIAHTRATSLLHLGRLDAAYDVITQLEPPWPDPLSALLAKLACAIGVTYGVERGQLVINEIEKNIAEKQEFQKFLQVEIVRETSPLLQDDHRCKTLTPMVKYILSHMRQLEPQYVVSLSEFFISKGEYEQVAELLVEYPDLGSEELNRKREWLLLLSSTVSDNSPLSGETGLRADEVLLENSLYHFKNNDKRCFIWFAGFVLANSMVVLEILIPLLKSRGISLMVVADKKRYMSLGGFGPFFPDRFQAREALGEVLKLKGYRELATSACSGSGLSALLYGMELGARGVLGLNALTIMPEDVPGVNPVALKHRNKLFKSITVTPSDSYELVEKNPDSEVFLSFSEDFSFDYDNAHHLADLANVSLWPEKHDSHDILSWLQDNNQLQSTFEKFLDRIGWVNSCG